MKLLFKMTTALRFSAVEDLKRPHEFAHERVGFFCCRAAATNSGLMVLAETYDPVADENYVRDETVGARINGAALRNALQLSLTKSVSIFHVHMHDHAGPPGPSRIDVVESKKFIPDFFNITPSMPHGTIILSRTDAFGLCWTGKNLNPRTFDRIELFGATHQKLDVTV